MAKVLTADVWIEICPLQHVRAISPQRPSKRGTARAVDSSSLVPVGTSGRFVSFVLQHGSGDALHPAVEYPCMIVEDDRQNTLVVEVLVPQDLACFGAHGLLCMICCQSLWHFGS